VPVAQIELCHSALRAWLTGAQPEDLPLGIA